MEKIIIILTLFCLVSCDNHSVSSCQLYSDDKQISIYLEADNDDINSIQIIESFILPYQIIGYEDKMKDIYKQVGTDYILHDNYLSKQYSVELEERYSLSETIKFLTNQRFSCGS